MNIVLCIDEQASQWDDFAMRHGGTYCHRYSWSRTLRQGYGLKTFNLVFEEGGEWRAILPLALLPWPLHRKAVSLPYASYGGILPAISEDLFPTVARWLRENGIHSLELRYLGGEDTLSNYVTMIRELPACEDELLASFSSEERRELKIARKNTLEVHWDIDRLDDFYTVYAANMGRLGTPVHARGFMRALVDCFGEMVKIITVSHDAHIIGGMLLMCEKEVWSNPFASSLWQYQHLRPSRLLYYEAMAAAVREGVDFFDFGRSRRHSGTWAFKRSLKASEKAFNYVTLYSDGRWATSGGTQAYTGIAGQTAVKCWSCLPLGLQNTVGPFLRKFIP